MEAVAADMMVTDRRPQQGPFRSFSLVRKNSKTAAALLYVFRGNQTGTSSLELLLLAGFIASLHLAVSSLSFVESSHRRLLAATFTCSVRAVDERSRGREERWK